MSVLWPDENASESDHVASLSQRSSLLSSPDHHDHPDWRDHVPRGPGVKFRHARERAHSTASQRDLLNLLVNEEYESKQTRKILYTAFDRLEHETRRAEAAEARIEEVVHRARTLNDARVAAQQQAVRAQEELKLYKLQLDNAQKEILRAQDVLKAIEAQRDEAEAAAVSARSKARRLNEERLIELAREEGRRLGFEEGVRRGRRMGYREAYSAEGGMRGEMEQVATRIVNGLIEDREDEPEAIEVIEAPTPIPPPPSARTPPEVHRIETPIESSLENQRHSSRSRHDSSTRSASTLRQTTHDGYAQPPSVPTEPRIIPARTPTAPSQGSRPHSVAQSWTGPPTEPQFARPTSIQNSPQSARRADFHVPPDNYIPTADSHHNISLPPPHEMQRSIPSPTPSQRTLGPSTETGRPRDYMYDNNHAVPRRGSPDESLASTKQSYASSISQLDIVGLPSRAERSQGLSVIHEDPSMRSDYSQTIASPSDAGRNSFREMPSSDTLRQDRKSRQQLADGLRHSDPSAPEQWRRQAESRSQQPQLPPRHRPSAITVPTPLSPPRVLQQPDSRSRRTADERQGRTQTRSDYSDQRRRLSSDSSVPEINVEPPSGPPSDAPSRGRGHGPVEHGLLSPDHAHQPLPMPGPPQPPPHPHPVLSNGRSAPASGSPASRHANLAGEQMYSHGFPDGRFSPGFLGPSSNGGGGGAPPQAPVIPGASQRYSVPYGMSTSSERDRERDRLRETGRSKTPVSFYAASPVPVGVTYPAPPISRSATYSAGVPGSNPSVESDGHRARRDSQGSRKGKGKGKGGVQMAGSADSSGGGIGGGVSRRTSSASLGSRGPYTRYDPGGYNDPAALASSESLVDSVTGANTVANGGGVVRPVRVNVRGSPAYAYAPLRE